MGGRFFSIATAAGLWLGEGNYIMKSARTYAEALEELRGLIPVGRIDVSEAGCRAGSLDNLRLSVMPEAVIRPVEEAEIGAILRVANRFGVALTVRGAGSSATGSAVPVRGGWVLDLSGWTRVEVDADAGMAYCQPGVRTKDLKEAAARAGWFYPPDPSSAAYSTIGGNIACNAGGMTGGKYGVTRDYVLALEGFLPTGEWVRWGAPLRKFAAGLNMRDLWVGSEGMLGVITGAVLRLIPPPAAKSTMLALFVEESGALEAVRAIHQGRLVPTVLEFIDRQSMGCLLESGFRLPEGAEAEPGAGASANSSRAALQVPAVLLCETDGHAAQVAEDAERLEQIFRSCGGRVMRARDAEEAEALWQARRRCSQAMYRLAPHKLNEDVVVPLAAQKELLAFVAALRVETGLPTPTFGHAMDGNFHVHVMYDRTREDERQRAAAAILQIMRKVVELGGAISGEHGIGLAKSPFMDIQHSAAEISMMQKLKQTFDPKGILNPGKMFESFSIWDHATVQTRLPWDH